MAALIWLSAVNRAERSRLIDREFLFTSTLFVLFVLQVRLVGDTAF
jgi:hypothetical protein